MGMMSMKTIYRLGRGPSSSHTMAPEKGARFMLENYPQADSFKAVLQGSLAKTGIGHRTDYAIAMTFEDKPCEIVFDNDTNDLPHPNTFIIYAYKDGKEIAAETMISLGGGALKIEGHPLEAEAEVYKEDSLESINAFCEKEKISLLEYVYTNEPDLKDYLASVWEQMKETVGAGIRTEGVLPGGLNVRRRGKEFFNRARRERDMVKKEQFMISACAYAASEENAAGGRTVTAPTCGASGVIPAVLCYEYELFGCRDEEMIDALAIAGIFGLLIKTNASVSGAEAGCQAEVGSASSMAAAAIAYLRGLNTAQIEAAAEIAMEHCLGLTCDPVNGLVQIPCIERNAVGALRAHSAAMLAEVVYENRKVSFDAIVATMYETGKDLLACYKETSEAGLAKTLKIR